MDWKWEKLRKEWPRWCFLGRIPVTSPPPQRAFIRFGHDTVQNPFGTVVTERMRLQRLQDFPDYRGNAQGFSPSGA